ncbi:undecaprenyl-phosphate glucose phosphotransferase [Telmatospirillum sp. J64-1]|uniref:undecaprenyl-phosphate glucose phosphotransferase n=1 Tax=Telmatospirillum sp. J64-1 TaxID=2502183 RepID=UPI00115F7499|nr:undecaprenyl-phosphate glucose phosphotransferase [Telmatospirillum sp. J64-1]
MRLLGGGKPVTENAARRASIPPLRSPSAPPAPPLIDRDAGPGRRLGIAARLWDALAVAAGGLFASVLVGDGAGNLLLPLVALQTLLAVNLFTLTGLYPPRSDAAQSSWPWRPAAWLLAAMAVPAVLLAATQPPPNWPWLGAWWLTSSAIMVSGRSGLVALWLQMKSSPRFMRRVLVVGDLPRSQQVLHFLASNGDGWHSVAGVLIDGHRPALSEATREGFIGRLDDLERVMRTERVDDVIVALPWAEVERMDACLARLRQYPVDVHLFPDRPEAYMSGHRGLSVWRGMPLVRHAVRPIGPVGRMVKNIEDKLLGGLMLLFFGPLMLVIAVLIKLDSRGPVLFRQERYGYNNEIFHCFKFRSMHVHQPEAVVEQAKRDDPRVTRVGRFLRRTSLDELPQLLNVMNGTMSLVGPRPHAVSHQNYYEKLVDDYRCRHRMKPGITGWAQVNGLRGETSKVEQMRRRVEHDLHYIDNWSLWLDLKILFLTPVVCLRGDNAY